MVRLLGAIILMVLGGPAWADYLVQRGDTLRVAVAETGDQSREVEVNADGRIMLPQLGSIEVAGSDLDSIRARVAEEFAARGIVLKATVSVEVAVYRPFYIGGAVAKPGAIAFEPGLTVRHALLLAGGVEQASAPELPSAPELLELKAKWQTTSYALLQVESRIARLEAELHREGKPDLGNLDTGSVPASDAEDIRSLDEGLYADRLSEWTSGQGHLESVLGLVDFEIGVLSRQETLQNKERDLQHAQVESAQSLLSRGLVPLQRVQELEREESALARDLLENQAYAARARQKKADAQYQLDSSEAQWRIEVRNELSGALLERARLDAERQTAAEALVAAGVSLAGGGAASLEPAVVIHRTKDGADTVIDADLGTPIEPGDLLEVSLAEAAAG